MAKSPKYPIQGSPYFDVREFVHPRVWNIYKEQAAMFVNPTNVRIHDAVRERYGPTSLNNWMSGGERLASGFRARWEHIGGEYSQHRLGNAGDSRSRDATPEEIYHDILKNPMPFWEIGLRRMRSEEHTSELQSQLR
jgi:hypothetical protein